MSRLYNSINETNVTIFKKRRYVADDGTYKYEYICEATPNTKLSDPHWRITRYRFNSSDSEFIDQTRPKATNPQNAFYEQWTAEFIFPATDLATVQGLSYDDG